MGLQHDPSIGTLQKPLDGEVDQDVSGQVNIKVLAALCVRKKIANCGIRQSSKTRIGTLLQ